MKQSFFLLALGLGAFAFGPQCFAEYNCPVGYGSRCISGPDEGPRTYYDGGPRCNGPENYCLPPQVSSYSGYAGGFQYPVRPPGAPSVPYAVYDLANRPLPAGTPAGTVFVPQTVSGSDKVQRQLSVSGSLYRNGQYVGARTVTDGSGSERSFQYPFPR